MGQGTQAACGRDGLDSGYGTGGRIALRDFVTGFRH